MPTRGHESGNLVSTLVCYGEEEMLSLSPLSLSASRRQGSCPRGKASRKAGPKIYLPAAALQISHLDSRVELTLVSWVLVSQPRGTKAGELALPLTGCSIGKASKGSAGVLSLLVWVLES